jgi:hypothetical protein
MRIENQLKIFLFLLIMHFIERDSFVYKYFIKILLIVHKYRILLKNKSNLLR